MKTFLILSLSVLALIPTLAGTAAVMADGMATQTQQSVTVDSEPLALLKAQATSSDATLPRPL